MTGLVSLLWIFASGALAGPEDQQVEGAEAANAVEEPSADQEQPSAETVGGEVSETLEEGEESGNEAPAAVPLPPPLDLAALQAQLEAQQAELKEQRQQLAEQAAGIENLNKQLTDTKLKMIKPDTFKVEIEGYYRTRAYVFPNLFHEKTKESRDSRYLSQRLRFRPVFNYKDVAKLTFQVNALHDVVWGDNQSLTSTALFAGSPSATNPEGLTIPGLELSRVWAEFKVPVGLVRIGRMPSHWGMGLLANDGDGFRNSFGEANTAGATYDRAIFATRPIAIAQTLMGINDTDIPFIVAVGVDRLVEDPLIQFHGYKCEAGIYDDDDAYDPRCDANSDGLTDLEHGLTDDNYTEDQRGQDWWADQDDDVMEMIYVVLYKGEDIKYFGGVGDLTAGTYIVHRIQKETDSKVVILDAYLKALIHGIALEFEGLHIRGNTRGIALPGSYSPTGDGDPLAKKAKIWGYVVRGGYKQPIWNVMFEHGYASGDENVADENFTGRPLHADHNAGLLLYEEVLARVTSQGWTDSARGLWSNGGVYNSRYIFPTASFMPLDNWELIGGFLMAWPDKPDGALIQCKEGEECSTANATKSHLGWELDFGLRHQFHKHILLAIEAGYAKATDRIPLETSGLNPKGNFFTFQSRIAWKF